MRRILAAALLALLMTSCDVIRSVITLTFNESAETVTISAATHIPSAKPGDGGYEEGRSLREALVAGQDEWSKRFEHSDPRTERIVFDKSDGELKDVQHSATIASENLQKFFYDTPLSVAVLRAEGWAELSIYPGTSMRATTEQRRNVEKELARFSARAAAYIASVSTLYRYMDEFPQRAQPMFKVMMADKDVVSPDLSERENDLVTQVRTRIGELLEISSARFNTELDLVFNPFPAELHVVLPGEPLAVEGFTKLPEGGFAIKPLDAMEALASLEGRWVSPDPLGIAVGGEGETADQQATRMAGMPRHAAIVVGMSEVANALTEKMKPAPRYRVRWIIRPSASSSSPPLPRRPGSSEGERKKP